MEASLRECRCGFLLVCSKANRQGELSSDESCGVAGQEEEHASTAAPGIIEQMEGTDDVT